MKTQEVKTSSRNYRIYFEPGMICTGAAEIAKGIFSESGKILLVTDRHIYSIYHEKINSLLSDSGFEYRIFKLEKGKGKKPGEYKSDLQPAG